MDPVMDYIMGWSLPALLCLIAGLILMVYEMFTPGMALPPCWAAFACWGR